MRIDKSTGKKLQADCIEIGNEEFNSQQDPSPLPKTGCASPLKYVGYVRTVLPLLRAPVASGGGGWVPSGTFQARVGAYGIVHSQQAETKSFYGVLVAPPIDATWNPKANHNSIFGYDPTLKCQMLDYANFHNYTDIWSVPNKDYDQGTQCADIRAILDKAGNTTIPVWCTEAGENGPCSGATALSQAKFFSANADGSGPGVLAALKAAGCQHFDVFTMNYNQPNTSGTYVGEPMAIAAMTKSPSGYVRFQAFTQIANFMTLQDKGAWAAQMVPAGFKSSTHP